MEHSFESFFRLGPGPNYLFVDEEGAGERSQRLTSRRACDRL